MLSEIKYVPKTLSCAYNHKLVTSQRQAITMDPQIYKRIHHLYVSDAYMMLLVHCVDLSISKQYSP